jgi:hypothetical protein
MNTIEQKAIVESDDSEIVDDNVNYDEDDFDPLVDDNEVDFDPLVDDNEVDFDPLVNDNEVDNIVDNDKDLPITDEESLIIDANAFWYKVYRTQEEIHSTENPAIIYNYLTYPYANLQIMISKKSHLQSYSNRLTIHIVPNGEKNIQLMNKLYSRRVPLTNIDVQCYRPYNDNNIIPPIITIDNITVEYSDLWFQGSIGYKNNKPVVNMLIVVKELIANKILKKETVSFKNETTTSRVVYFQTIPVIDAYLDHIIGEYNLLNHIGYIELLPSNAEIITQESTFTELSDVKKLLQLACKSYNYKHCIYCNVSQLQCDLLRCSICKTAYYCSKVCQISNWSVHKKICSV